MLLRMSKERYNMKIKYGTQVIEFTVEYRSRKTIEIGVEPPDIVTVIAPKGASEDIIRQRVMSKAKWITQKLYEINHIQSQRLEREYVNGEAFMYLGRNYTLKIVEDLLTRRPVTKLYQGKFYITTSIYDAKDQNKLKRSMESWYRQKTYEKVCECIEYYQKYFEHIPSDIKIKEQKKRWGSCTAKRELLFNWRCVMAPAWVLDYIVVHEMCHMYHMDHSKEFWALVERVMPDYEKRREWLRNYGIKMDL